MTSLAGTFRAVGGHAAWQGVQRPLARNDDATFGFRSLTSALSGAVAVFDYVGVSLNGSAAT